MIAALSFLVLFVSAAFSSRAILSIIGVARTGERLAATIAWGTLCVGWSLGCALSLAFVAELSGLPLVRMPVAATLSTVLAVASVIICGRYRQAPTPLPPSVSRRLWPRTRPGYLAVIAVLLPVAALHVFLLIEAFLRPPLAFDGLCYHLPQIVRWLRDGQLSMMQGVWQYCLPSNGELWQMFFASTGVEQLIEPGMFPIGLLLALVVAGIARELGATSHSATICSLLALACPIVSLQMYSSYVDMFSVAFLLNSLYWILRLGRRTLDWRETLGTVGLAGLSLGIALGTKPTMTAWAAPVVLGFIAILVGGSVPRPRAAGDRRFARWPRRTMIAVFVAASLVCSGYWYFRSAHQTGWPLYPVRLHIGPWTLGSGDEPGGISAMARHGWWSLIHPWGEAKRAGYPYTVDNGLGPMFAAFAMPGLAYLLFRRLRWDRRRNRLADLMVLSFVAIGIVLFVEVFYSCPRFALALGIVMFAAAGPVIDLLLRRWPGTCTVLLGVSVTLSAAMIALWPAKTLAGRLYAGDLRRTAVYGTPELFEHLPEGTVVLNMSSALANYPLLGPRWSNQLIESMVARKLGLGKPLTQSQLETHGVEIVYACEEAHQLFASDVAYEKIYDEQDNPAWSHRYPPARAYRILRALGQQTATAQR